MRGVAAEATGLPIHTLPAAFCSTGGGSGGQAAKDALGNDVKSAAWLKTHPVGDRSLTQGLKVGPLEIAATMDQAQGAERGPLMT